MAHLNVNPADLAGAAEEYTQLAAAAAVISPRAAEEISRIIATHGVMGYPVAVGILTGLAPREAKVNAKAAAFTSYAQRFSEHAASYISGDADAADGLRGIAFDTV
ncbi:type VII secretion target [Mycobacterium servetii]|uniref:Type VII secretion target n=1 Tax=Mycobacterium servetii TaxID=3237418 RepID=A0ABV4C9C4_9MYCO